MSDSKKDLKPCPFCRAKEHESGRIWLTLAESSEGYFAVVCLCGGSGPIRDTEEKAIEAWNTSNSSDQDLFQYPFDFPTSTAEVGFKGILKSIGVSSILQILSSENRTGILQFGQGQTIWAIYLKDGKIIAASGKEGLRLGQIFYSKGLISQKQLQEALNVAKESDNRVGEVLLDLGYISEESLKKLIRHQIREALLEISFWLEGFFEYRDCPLEFDERGIEDISTMGIILETAVRKDELAAA